LARTVTRLPEFGVQVAPVGLRHALIRLQLGLRRAPEI
jgi:hypothetical protein